MQPHGDARTLRQPMVGGVPQAYLPTDVAGGYPQAGVAPGFAPTGVAPVMVQPGMVPQVAVGVMPAPMQVGMNMPMNGFAHIEQLPQLQVKEKANMIQEITAMLGAEIEMANKYNVLDAANNQVFYAVEETDCCRRQLQNGCCHDCAPYDVNILYTPIGMPHQLFVRMTRPWQCTCCCLNRPTADVNDMTTGTPVKIGSFKDPCTCCCLKFEVNDETDKQVLEVDGGCLCTQPGMLCPLPCGPCSKVEFDVKDVNSGNVVAKVQKQVPSCLSWCFTPDIDNYQLEFDHVQNPKWKAILLAFTIFMDFRYFNVNRNQQDAQSAFLQS